MTPEQAASATAWALMVGAFGPFVAIVVLVAVAAAMRPKDDD